MISINMKYFLNLAIICMFVLIGNLNAQESSEEEECESKNFRVELTKSALQKMEIKTHEVKESPYTQKLSAVGKVIIPVESTVNISSRAKGFVSSSKYKIGDEIDEENIAKMPLVWINSKELGLAKSELISESTELRLLKKQYDREKKLYNDKLSTQQSVLDAELKYERAKIEVLQARQNLILLGLTEKAVEEVVAKNDLSPLLPIYAPFTGKIIEKNIAVGQIVKSDESLFKVANLDRLIVELDIYEKNLTSIELGQRVFLNSKAYVERKFRGKVTYISDTIDEKTKTLKVWVSIKNKSRKLKPGMFMTAEIIVAENEDMMRIPKASIQNDGLSCCTLVFAVDEMPKKDKNMVTTHKVEVGLEDKNTVQILAGLMPGQKVITDGAFLIKSELLKSNFGAG